MLHLIDHLQEAGKIDKVPFYSVILDKLQPYHNRKTDYQNGWSVRVPTEVALVDPDQFSKLS